MGIERIQGLGGKQSVLGLCTVIVLCVGFSLHLMLINLVILLEKSCDQGPRDTILYTLVPALRRNLSLAGEIPARLLPGTLVAPFSCFSSFFVPFVPSLLSPLLSCTRHGA